MKGEFPGLGSKRLRSVVEIVVGASVFIALVPLVPLPAFPAPPATVTYSSDVRPLINDRCAMCHHPGGSGPFSLLTYADVKRHAGQIVTVTRSRYMPPWKADPTTGPFVGQHPLSDQEIAMVKQWADEGAPEGEAVAPTAPEKWTEGWQLGNPDLVVTLKEPYALRAEGTDVFRIFVIPVPIQATRFVRALEFRPGNPKVVHHANIRIDRTPASRRLDEADPAPGYEGLIARSAQYPDGHFLGWTPGQISPLLPKDMAWRLEPGSDLVVEIHMQPSGKPERVQPSIGLFFGEVPPTRTPTMLRLGRQGIDIPAGDKDYVITDSYVLPVDVEVEAVQPHAHYRAHTVHGEARLPDGTTKSLIDIADWDFRWQHVYRFVTPFRLPKGSTIAMRYVYDNSEENPRNPERPPKRTLWGQRSADEMGDLWVQVLTRNNRDLAVLETDFRPKVAAEDVIGYEVEIRKHPTEVGLHDDAALLYLELDRPDEAVKHFQASLQLKPGSAAAHYNLGIALTAARKLPEAVAQYQQALRIDPNYVKAHNNLGSVFIAQGRFDDALREYREVVRLEPDGASGVANLAWPLATAPSHTPSDASEAVRLAARAADLTHRQDPSVLDVLAAAYAAAGQFDKAIEATDEALRLGPQEPLASGLRSRQVLYKQHMAYVASATMPR